MNMGKIVNALKWMKISVLNRAEKNPKFKPFKISDSMGILRAAENAMVLIAGNRPQLVEVCVQVIERR
jgi:hypothetical protein